MQHNNLLTYINYINTFKNINKIMIMDHLCNIVHISDVVFFAKYNAGFKTGANVLDCLKTVPCFDIKKTLYDQLLKNKKIIGYFVAQRKINESEYMIDRINLSPIYFENDLIGIELEAIEVEQLPLITIQNHSCEIRKIDNEIQLTEREKEILILKAMGKTNEQISEILEKIQNRSISKNTVANIIKQQLYPKFGVQNKADLITKAHELGLDTFIPKSMITNNQIILLQD